MSLENLEQAGEISSKPAGKTELKDLLRKAARKLGDAQAHGISPETRLELAYTVILTCAMTALRATGYRVTSVSAVHYTAIETLRYTLGLDEDRIDYYQSLRVLRHRDIYGPDFAVDEDDLGEAISEAAKLLKETIEWLSSVHPDLV